MADGPSLETFANNVNSQNGAQSHEAGSDVAASGTGSAAKGAVFIIGLAVVAAAVTFGVVRAVTRRRPADPTTERIQQLIDEANRLLKQLDEKQPAP